MVEGARLESVYSGNAIAGSNPALSAVKLLKPLQSKSFVIFRKYIRLSNNRKKAKLRFMY